MPPQDRMLLWQRIAAATDAIGSERFAHSLLELLALLAPYDSALVVYYGRRRRPLVLADELRNPARTNGSDQYVAGAYALDPFYIKSREVSETCLLRLREIAPADFESTDYFRHYYRGSHVVDEVNLFVPLEPGRVFAVSLGRAIPSPSFSDDNIDQLHASLEAVASLARRHMAESGLIGAPDEGDAGYDRVEHALQSFGDSVLTPREREVLGLMLSGLSVPDVARRLGVSLDTAKVHRRNIYGKLGVSSLAGLFSMVLQSILRPDGSDRLAGLDAL